ncbi:MAG: hypothetical protein PHU27_11210 [Salinivirgaceae bacterium]|nr:hypothetical protein [Salinivirgaceae bacterium]MDD4746604.1 hypothetical protein [Salinivirgaceae bacterium]
MDIQNVFFERYGSLRKYEKIDTIEDTSIIPGTLVFEAPNPFPGYYHKNPSLPKPLYVYFALENHLSQEQLMLVIKKIRSYIEFDFSAAKAKISFFNEQYTTIRIRELNNYSQVRILQEAFAREGLVMKYRNKNFKDVEVIITMKKFFQFLPINEEMMFDRTEGDQGYFKIPYHLDWQTFSDITNQVSHNVSILEFDAAMGMYFENYNVIDVIRIFSPRITMEMLQDIKNEYLTSIKRFNE